MFSPLPAWPILYVYTAAAAFTLAALLTPAAIWALRRLGAVDPVAQRKIHESPTPRGGGIVIFVAFAVAVLLPNYRDNPMKGVLLGSFICLVVGAIDDLRGGIPAVFKFCALTAATLFMSYFGVRLDLFHNVWLDLGVTLLWVVGVTSAFNGIDNMDGLAAGIAAIVSAMFLFIALEAHSAAGTETSLSWFGLLAGLIGGNIGFLLFNWRPARVFMGDAGSFFLGFTLAALSVMGEWSENRVISCTIPILILGVPILDFAYILLARVIKGETRTLRAIIEHCAADHLSHRLVRLGFSQPGAVLIIYVMTVTLGIAGILVRDADSLVNTVLGLVQGFSIVFVIIILMLTAERRRAEAVLIEVARFNGGNGAPPASTAERTIEKSA